MESPLQSVEKKHINKYQDQAAFEADPEQIVSGARVHAILHIHVM